LQYSVILLFRRPTRTRCPNLVLSRLSVHVAGDVSLFILNVYHSLIPMSHLRFRCQRNIDAIFPILRLLSGIRYVTSPMPQSYCCIRGMPFGSHIIDPFAKYGSISGTKEDDPVSKASYRDVKSQCDFNRQITRSRYPCAIISGSMADPAYASRQQAGRCSRD
jgi:hypothetical protein